MVSTRHGRQMRATSLSRAGNRGLGLDHSCVTHINYNGIAYERLISLSVPALPDVFILDDTHI
jgi:hypothetical protein